MLELIAERAAFASPNAPPLGEISSLKTHIGTHISETLFPVLYYTLRQSPGAQLSSYSRDLLSSTQSWGQTNYVPKHGNTFTVQRISNHSVYKRIVRRAM